MGIMSFIKKLDAALVACLLLALSACGGNDAADTADSASLSAKAAVGKELFFDVALSASGQQSCASCHVPSNAFAPTDGRATALGGVHMDLPGLRNTPTLTYVSLIPAAASGSVGGFFHDGRSPTLAHQAQQPFLTVFEMGNADAAEVLQRLLARPYLQQFRDAFGSDATADPDAALRHIGEAIAAFETEDPAFRPFSSKFDYWVKGQAQLSAQELSGMQLFNSPNKGNCAACHVSSPVNGTPALFTNFKYDSIGVPRNWNIRANAANSGLAYVPQNGLGLGAPGYSYYDMGVCGPMNTGSGTDPSACGKFKIPTLRNVALTAPYFHNGVFSSLNDVVSWYATRTSDSTRWYTQADGVTPDVFFNDVPAAYRDNVNIVTAPYDPAAARVLSDADIHDIVKFLCTLTDGYDPANPAAYRVPAQCSAP